MPFPLSADLTLYIDAQTSLISKMTRNNPQFGDLDYVFSGHEKRDGIYYATEMNFFIAGVPNLLSTYRNASFNFDVPEDTFSLPPGLSAEAERIDTSEMLVNKVSDRVFHIGQSGGFSIFIDTSAGIVAAGGYAALSARFDRFKEESNIHKPLAYQVVTHHHSDHIGGMGEAISLGAQLVTVDDNVQTIKDAVTPAPVDRDFLKTASRVTFGEGRNRVEVYEVSTIHAARFLVTYVPSEKMVFIADHMGSPFAQGTPVANAGTVDMLSALEGLDIDIRKIATAHNARIFSMQDMRDSVANYTPGECAGKRPVCS
jgi:glyoxylase-like metal-dependent hydrolase (beta-lactamase superfamily II)